jgi:hypothetical protein
MTRTQCPNMIAHSIQIVFERPNLRPGIIHILITPLLPMRDITRKIQSLHWENHMILRLVPKYTIFGREPLELNNDDWR